MFRRAHNRNKLHLNLEQLETRHLLASMPLLWMEDNSFTQGNLLPDDFIKRFEDPVTWQTALRTIDTLYMKEEALRNSANNVTASVLRDTIAPVLNASQANVSIDTGVANFLQRRTRGDSASIDQELQSHFNWLGSLVNSGLRVQSISLRGVMSETVPGDPTWSSYSLTSRIADVVAYAVRVKQQFPWMRVGIIDASPTKGLDYSFNYRNLQASMDRQGVALDHVHLDMPVNLIGSGLGFTWDSVFQIQRYVQTTLDTRFGLMLTSQEGGDFSNHRWAQRIMAGLYDYQLAIRRLSTADTQPDRIVITSNYRYPTTSVPEFVPTPLVDDLGDVRLRNTTQSVIQLSNLLRDYEDFSESRLQNELIQVFPVAAVASTTASSTTTNRRTAQDAVFGRGIVDAFDSTSQFQWQAASGDTTPWLKAVLPKRVGIDRLRLWPYRGSTTTEGGAIVDIYVSRLPQADASSTDNPLTNPTGWSLVSTTDLRGTSDNYVEARFSLAQTPAVAIVFRNAQAQAGLAGMRIYAPVPGWINPYQSPLASVIPTVDVQGYYVVERTGGQPVADLFIGGASAAQNFQLSISDTRFVLNGNRLSLANTTSLDRTQTPSIAVWVKLQSRSTSSFSFSKLVTFIVYPQGSSAASLDFGDAPASYGVLQNADGASHVATGPILGTRRTAELDGTPSTSASLSTDDDGVQFAGLVAGAHQASIQVTASNITGRAIVEAWIDFDGDGTWDGGNERVVTNSSASNGLTEIHFIVPADAKIGTTFARVRLSNSGTRSPRGAARDGEVEDYQIAITAAQPGSTAFVQHDIALNLDGARMVKPLDIDRDGDIDLVTASELDHSFRLWVNDGHQQFTSSLIGRGDYALSVDIADVDLDGDLDILATTYGNQSQSIAVGNELLLFRNSGNLTFTRSVLATGLRGAYTVKAADMDRDGDLDALVSASTSNVLYWYENQFASDWVAHFIGSVRTPRSMIAADIDGDSDQDIVVTAQDDNSVILYRNTGGQRFAAQVIDSTFSQAVDAVITDFDRDGDLDIVASQLGPELRWYEQSNGSFSPRSITTSAGSPRSIQVVDLDGDGMLDIVTSGSVNDQLIWHRNRGQLVFETRTVGNGIRFLLQSTALDMDGDGDLDIAGASYTDDALRWFEQTTADRGDLPISFEPLNDPAMHRVTSLFLGRSIDADKTSQASINADGDDHDTSGNDDDGITMLTTLRRASSAYSGSFLVNASQAGYIDAWFDFNSNGRFEHPQEHFTGGIGRQVSAGFTAMPLTIPAGLSAAGRVAARFRLSPTGNLTPGGMADGGEVEDYYLSVDSDSIDPRWCVRFPTITIAINLEIILTAQTTTVQNTQGVLLNYGGQATDPLDIVAGPQDDVLRLRALEPQRGLTFQGGSGTDTLSFDQVGGTLDLAAGMIKTDSIEVLSLVNGSSQHVQVPADLPLLDPQSPTDLTIMADSQDAVSFDTAWRVLSPSFNAQGFAHRLTNTKNTVTVIDSAIWTNPVVSNDVNGDGQITPIDALFVINAINQKQLLRLPTSQADVAAWTYLDSNRSASLEPLDALLVINAININQS